MSIEDLDAAFLAKLETTSSQREVDQLRRAYSKAWKDAMKAKRAAAFQATRGGGRLPSAPGYLKSPTRQDWARWLGFHGIPYDHVATIAGIPLADAEAIARKPRRGDPPRPWRPRARPPRIWAETAIRVRVMTGLGYDPARIAVILDQNEAAIRDFLTRLEGVLEGPPRTPARQAQREAWQARRAAWAARKREARRLYAAARYEVERLERAARRAAWAGGDGPADYDEQFRIPTEPDRARTPDPTPVPTPWIGSAKTSAGRETRRSSSGLDWEQVKQIAELRRGGMSTYELARRFGVARNTIRDILSGKRWQGLGKVE